MIAYFVTENPLSEFELVPRRSIVTGTGPVNSEPAVGVGGSTFHVDLITYLLSGVCFTNGLPMTPLIVSIYLA